MQCLQSMHHIIYAHHNNNKIKRFKLFSSSQSLAINIFMLLYQLVIRNNYAIGE